MNLSRRTMLLAAAGRLWPQEAQQAPTFSTGVDVVTVFATVRSPDGSVVKNLDRDDFRLEEDGVQQTIRYFSRESDLPLTIGVLVDTSQSQAHVLEPERQASYVFLDRVLREGRDRAEADHAGADHAGPDQAFIAHFDTRVEVLQDFTSSRKDLAAALSRLKVPTALATLLYDAVRDLSEKEMKPRQGRKAFILLSDGVDYHSKNNIVTAIEFAQRADTIIYSILFEEPLKPYRPLRSAILSRGRERGHATMQRLAVETGGSYFVVTKDLTLETVYSRIEEALRNQYSLGYTPEKPPVAGQYRSIKLTTKKPGLVVQARQGYYCK